MASLLTREHMASLLWTSLSKTNAASSRAMAFRAFLSSSFIRNARYLLAKKKG